MKCNEVVLMVNNTHLFESEDISLPPENKEDTGFLPGPSLVLTILSLTIGLIYSTRRE